MIPESKLAFLKEKKITAWGIAKDLAKLTDLGVDEAHDVVVGVIKKRGGRFVEA